MYRKFAKRVIDFCLSLLALTALSPFMLVVALLVRIKLGSPVLFIQQRVGKDEKLFNIYKFRSMINEKDEKGNHLSDEVRLTKFGKALRDWSLDELPQLLNIIKGDMAIIGPRALPAKYLPLYTDEQKRRHEVRPGLSNCNIFTGRSKTPWEERFKNDVYYIDHYSFMLDTKIVIKTVIMVLKREGVHMEGSVTNEEYTGLMTK